MQTLASIIAIFLYLLSFFVLFRQIKSDSNTDLSLFKGLFALSILAHITTLHFNVFPNQALHLGFFRVSSLIFCVISIISMMSILRKLPIENLALIVLPMCALSIGIGEWAESPTSKIIEGSGLIIRDSPKSYEKLG